MPRVVILGTGTGVGKTYVTAALARALAARGARVLARKPVETGIDLARRGGRANSTMSDASTLDAASTVPARAPHPLYAFRDPLSPHLASEREGVSIRVPRIKVWLDADLGDMTPHATSLQLVETAGGVFSPLGRRTTNLDLARALDPAVWVLIAHDGLGVLHDVRSTLMALESASARRPDYLVLSAARAADASTGTNARELTRVGLPKPVAVVHAGGDAVAQLEPLARALLKRLRT